MFVFDAVTYDYASSSHEKITFIQQDNGCGTSEKS